MFGRLGVALAFKKYHSCKKWKTNIKENIEFVSISVDNIKDRENGVTCKQNKWEGILADKDLSSEFIMVFCHSPSYSSMK
jgi:hypothetical protein